VIIMHIEMIVGGVVAVGLLIYLVYALLVAERF
jgi:K+-transporting ATPase KdpF subunit